MLRSGQASVVRLSFLCCYLKEQLSLYHGVTHGAAQCCIYILQFQYKSCRLSHHTNLTIILFLTFFVSESLCTVKMSLTPMSKSMRDSTSCTNCLWLSWGTHGILTISRQLCLTYCCTSSIATSLPYL